MKQKAFKIKIVTAFILLAAIAVLFCVLSFASDKTKADAAGNSKIYTFAATDYMETKEINLTSPTGWDDPVSSSAYRNTGIQIYAASNSGSVSTGDTVNLDSGQFYIDFNGATIYRPSNLSVIMDSVVYFDDLYSFEILRYGSIVWYARFTSDYNGDVYSKTVNINGNSTLSTSESKDLIVFNPMEFGKRYVNLSSGAYTIKIRRQYNFAVEHGPLTTRYSEMSGNLLIDTTNPTSTLTGYTTGKNIANGSYVNEKVTFSASDENFNRLYYKTPTANSYSSTSSKSYTTGVATGWYYMYAEDKSGNVTPTYSIYYDPVKPTGNIKSNGVSVASGAYISESFSYSATDTDSGIANIYYRTPTNGNYQTYTQGTIIPRNAGDGWYYFYAVDRSGNQSNISSVYLETAAPLVEIYRNGTLAFGKTVTEAGNYDTDIYVNERDVLRVKYESSSGKATCNYGINTDVLIDGNYPNNTYKISLTTATGITTTYTYRIVREKPYISVNGVRYGNGATVRLKEDTAITFNCDEVISDTADTGAEIVSDGNVQINEKIPYSQSRTKTFTTAEGTQTKYLLKLSDRAGNESNITVYIDKEPAVGEWISDGNILPNDVHTNKPLSFEFDESDATATYSFNGGEYSEYTSGRTFFADGTYTVILTDLSGNKSSFRVVIDTVCPVGKLYANYTEIENNSVTNGKVYFSWDGFATATVNGQPYEKNKVLSEDDIYNFVLRDAAGNISEYSVEIDTVAPIANKNRLFGDKSYAVGKWYNVVFDGQKKSFESYDSALDYACAVEFEKFVTPLVLNSVSDFTQVHLIASKGNPLEDVRVGNYWRYKSRANESSELYYFDKEYLDEVIAFYAKNYISEVNYFDPSKDGYYGELSENMYDNIWIAENGTKAPLANRFVFTEDDSSTVFAEFAENGDNRVKVEFGIPFGKQFTESGLYKITETDCAGNVSTYFVYLDNSEPTLIVNAEVYGENEARELNISKSISEEIKAYYYKTFTIVRIADGDAWATVKVENNGNTKYYSYGDELPVLNLGGEYTITAYDRLGNSYSFIVYIVGSEATVDFSANADNTAFAVKIRLEQSFDTLVALDIYRNGVKFDGIMPDKLDYEFDKGGKYTVTLRDNFGRLIEKTFNFDKALPVGFLTGVENGGLAMTDVKFTFDSEKFYAEVTKDGQAYKRGRSGEMTFTVSDETVGNYIIRLIRLTDEENYADYSFVLELDSIAPTLELIGVKNGGVSGKSVMLDNLSEQATIEVFKDGELISYELGSELKEYGKYRVIVTDVAGNRSEYGFTLKHVLNGGAVALIVIGSVSLVGGVATVFIMRRKGIFGKIRAKKKG